MSRSGRSLNRYTSDAARVSDALSYTIWYRICVLYLMLMQKPAILTQGPALKNGCAYLITYAFKTAVSTELELHFIWALMRAINAWSGKCSKSHNIL